MKNNETKYNNQKITLPLIILIIIFYIIFPMGLTYGIIKVYTTPITETGLFQTLAMKIAVLFILIFLLCIVIVGILGNLFGNLKSRRVINKENKKINKENPYVYYRELPNNFGIGVTSLLFDSKIENYKDIVAVILDLCAKKYLSLVKKSDKYYIKLLKGIDDELLSNEKYILNLIISNNIKNINYEEWYNYCLQDGIDLGLYYHYDNQKEVINDGLVKKNEIKLLKKIHKNISLFIGIAIFIITRIATSGLLTGLLFALIGFAISYAVLIVPFYIIFIVIGVVNIGKMQKNINYDIAMDNHLRRTKKGILELQKLISLQNFLSDFGNFVDKKPEEVILWDRYLSYAQVFGLTNKIMESGYKQLVDNASFQIDDIDNITINNIEIL